MKIWKSVAQNVLSGCVGAALVMGSAQAQKAASKPAPQRELRVQKLVIVDENNKERGSISAFGASTRLRLDANKSFIAMDVSDSGGCSLWMGEKGNGFASLGASKNETCLQMSNGRGFATLIAGDGSVDFALTRKSKESKRGSDGSPPPVDVPAPGSKTEDAHILQASVGGDNSALALWGPSSAISLGSENGGNYAGLDYSKGSGSLHVHDRTGFRWKQPDLYGENKQ